jgi:hypothetical protein
MTEEQHIREREEDRTRWRWLVGLLVSAVIASVVPSVASILWVGGVAVRLERVEMDSLDQETRVRVLEGNGREVAEQLRGLTATTGEIKGTLQRLDTEVRGLPQAIYRAVNGEKP